MYLRDKDAIINYESSAFLLDNDIDKNTDELHNLIKEQSKLNEKTLKQNEKLEKKFKNLDSSNSSTKQMIDDKEMEYHLTYIKYYCFLLGSTGLIYYLYRAYRYRD